jgi:lysophospholipase L1-like esterase
LRDNCKSTSAINILTVGGSTTDLRYISDNRTYQAVLQNLLNSTTDKEICISNAGVDGHSTFGHIASFTDWFPLIPNLKPKYILFYVGINDAGIRDDPSKGYDQKVESELMKQLRERSAIYSLLKTADNLLIEKTRRPYAGHKIKQPRDIDYTEKHLNIESTNLIHENTLKFRQRFNVLMKLTKEYGAIPICVSQPHLFVKNNISAILGLPEAFKYKGKTFNGLDYNASIKSINSAMKDLCLNYNGIYIDIASKYFTDSDFYDVVHMTPKGEEVLANYLYQEFIKQGVHFY